MNDLYQQDLAYIQAAGFGDFARSAAPEIVRRLRAASTPVQRVVEVGCGAGPLTAILMDAGFDVTGIDVSVDLVKIARAVCPGAKFRVGSIYAQEIPQCDAIVGVGEPLTYHEGGDSDARVRDFFQRASIVLPLNAPLIFDLIELGKPALTGRSWKADEDWAVLVETTEDQDSRTLTREIETFRKVGDTYRRGREVHRVRLFDSGEVCHWLESAGFSASTAVAYGDLALLPRRRAFFGMRE
jgi:SAM-dependent methyltransferase